jgi:hypothetical protein
MDFDDGAAEIVLAREQHLGFELVEALGELVQLLPDLAADVLAFALQLEQRFEVGHRERNLGVVGQRLFEPLALAQQVLVRLGPECGGGDALFNLG